MKIIGKFLGIYSLLLILISFICSLLNLIGLNSTITNLILFIFNIALFFIFGFKNGKISQQKGYFSGMKISILMLLILYIINIIISQKFFSITMLIYYIVLFLTGTLGGMFGKAKKLED